MDPIWYKTRSKGIKDRNVNISGSLLRCFVASEGCFKAHRHYCRSRGVVLWCRECERCFLSPEEGYPAKGILKSGPEDMEYDIRMYIHMMLCLLEGHLFFISGPQILPQNVWVKMVKWISWAVNQKTRRFFHANFRQIKVGEIRSNSPAKIQKFRPLNYTRAESTNIP